MELFKYHVNADYSGLDAFCQAATGEVKSTVRQDVPTNDQVAVVLLARHHPRLSQHLRPCVRALSATTMA